MLLLSALTGMAYGQDQVAQLYGAGNLEDLLNTEVTVASSKPVMPSEAPAIVSVITREEIELSGARDLIDVLRMVPGFDFGVDIWNVVGLGFRGMWGHEGKIKLTVDGMPFNDLMYGNVPFGNHFPVESIERIEIIRGPGSSIYGNFAELAVINVVTQIGAEVSGFRATSTTGFFDKSFARQNVTLRYGKELEDGYFGASVFGGMAQRSAGNYIDQSQQVWNMANGSDLQTGNAELIYRNGGFLAGFMADNYETTHRDNYGDVIPYVAHARFVTYNGLMSYTKRINDNLVITPSILAAAQQPWRNTGVPISDPTYYDPTVQQYRIGLTTDWDVSSGISTMFGANYEWQIARYGGNEPERVYKFPDGAQQSNHDGLAVYNDWMIRTRPVNVTAGLRIEKTTGYDYEYSPRISLNRTFNNLSLKAIYNHAFRAPTIEQLSAGVKAGDKLKNETSNNYEFEVGYRINSMQNITANVFYLDMANPIVFFHDPVSNLDTYTNQGKVATAGAELQYRIMDDWGHLTFGYSYYRAMQNGASYYNIPGQNDAFLGFPAHKATLDAGYKLTQDLNLNTTLILTSDRFGFDHIDPDTGEPAIKRFGPEVVANLYLLYKNAVYKGVDVGIGVFDIFAANHSFIQPYNGGHSELPGPGREYVLRLSYTPTY